MASLLQRNSVCIVLLMGLVCLLQGCQSGPPISMAFVDAVGTGDGVQSGLRFKLEATDDLQPILERTVLTSVDHYVRHHDLLLEEGKPDFLYMKMSPLMQSDVLDAIRDQLTNQGFVHDEADPEFIVRVDGRYGTFHAVSPAIVEHHHYIRPRHTHRSTPASREATRAWRDEVFERGGNPYPLTSKRITMRISEDKAVYSEQTRLNHPYYSRHFVHSRLVSPEYRVHGEGTAVAMIAYRVGSADAPDKPIWEAGISMLDSSMAWQDVYSSLLTVLLDEFPVPTGLPPIRWIQWGFENGTPIDAIDTEPSQTRKDE